MKGKYPCKHLERTLPNPNKGRLTKEFIIENQEAWVRQESVGTNALEAKLTEYGLPEHEVELLMDRFVGNMSYEDIASRQGYNNRKDVHRLLASVVKRLSKSEAFKDLLKGLRKRGNN